MSLGYVSSSSLWRVKIRVSLAENSAGSVSDKERGRNPETTLVDLPKKGKCYFVS